MSVEALARQLAAVAPETLERFLATCDAEEHEAVEAALALLERERIALLAETWPTLPPDQAEALLKTLTDEQTASLQEELDIRDLDAFLEGRRAEDVRAEVEVDGVTWFSSLFPSYTVGGFAPHMSAAWEWAWTIQRGFRVRPRVDAWFRGGAKALAVETPVPTPYGWTTMGDLVPGSTVFDHAGRSVTVTAVSPIEERDAYRVGFRSGGELIASGDHLWAVTDLATRRAWYGEIPEDWPTWRGTRLRPDRARCAFPECDGDARTAGLCSAHYEQQRRGRLLRPVVGSPTRGIFADLATAVMTTDELRAAGLRVGSEARWAIPAAGALDLPDAWLTIEPWLLGAWLGDGTAAAGNITIGAEDRDAMVALIESTGRTVTVHEYGGAYRATVGGLHRDLRLAGLLGDKHLPARYLRASLKQRLAVLRGLMDTDGTPKRSGGELRSTRQALAQGVAELARSLGMRASVTEGRAKLAGRDCGPLWTVNVAGTVEPLFELPRKAARQGGVAAQPLNGRMHYVDAIEAVGTLPVRCITVDSPGSCYLAGAAMIPTHNSTTAEGMVAALGARGKRRYCLYVSGTQGQADRHVATLGAMLESKRFAAAYPDMARRAVTQYGTAKGWSRTRLHTASGFVVDALGLSVEARGIRIEEERPDYIVFDDVDSLSDGPAMVEKKIGLLTETILPAGSPDLVVHAIQNIIHPNSIFARLTNLADTPADFLADRIVVGPVPAAENLDVQPERQPDGNTRWTVKGGEPTWPTGYGLDVIQSAIDTSGLTAFLREGQHVVDAAPGGMFDHLTFRRADPGDVPFLVRKVCWMDPAVTDTDSSDSCAVQVDGVDAAGQMWRLWSWEARSSPQRALCLAVRVAARFGCPYVGVETDQGGDTWRSVYQEACDSVTQEDLDAAPDNEGVRPALDGGEVLPRAGLPGFTWAKAGAGHGPKVERAARMLVEYEGPRAPIHVMGTHVILEAALRRFPKTKPYDLVDSCYWSWHDLRKGGVATLTAPRGLVGSPPIVAPRQVGATLRTPTGHVSPLTRLR